MEKIICFKPFTSLEVHTGGNVTFCCYIQKMLGNLHDLDISTVYNSNIAQLIRKTFYDGTYSYCDKKRCELFLKKSDTPFMYQYLTDEMKFEIESKSTQSKYGPQVIVESAHGICNLKCRFCLDFKRFPKNKFVSEGYSAIFKNIKNLKHVTLAGGEPLYQKNVNILLKKLIANNISLALHSNFTFISDETKELLQKININSINISLNSTKKETYEYLMQGAIWERTLENIFWLDKLRREKKNVNLSFSMVVNNKNYGEIDEFIKLTLDNFKGNNITLYRMDVHPNNTYLELSKEEREITLKILNVLKTSDFEKYQGKVNYLGLLNSLKQYNF